MKGNNYWSYAPYRPLLTEVGDIYICRIAPGENSIHFEWLDGGEEYSVYLRKRGEEAFELYNTVKENQCDITDLETETDYEFYVHSGKEKSRIL